MRILFAIFFSVNALIGFSQSNELESDKADTVTFLVKVELKNATKDGLYINGYGSSVLHISYEEIKKLDGKTIEVTGLVTVVKGIKNLPKEYDDEGNEIIPQGREEDTNHLQILKYRIIED